MSNQNATESSFIASLRWSVKAAEENAAHHAKLAAYPGSADIQRQHVTYSHGYAHGLKAALDCCLWMEGRTADKEAASGVENDGEPMPQDCCIYPPECERYILATTFARRVCRGGATEKELDFMVRFLSIPTAFDE